MLGSARLLSILVFEWRSTLYVFYISVLACLYFWMIVVTISFHKFRIFLVMGLGIFMGFVLEENNGIPG